MGFWSELLGGEERDDDVKYKASRTQQHGTSTDAYFGGIEKPDGTGKGKIRIDDEGRERVVREPYTPGRNAKRDATLLDDVTPDRRR